jgi:hypothetical protein
MDLRILSITSPNTIYWTSHNAHPFNCPYQQRTCDLTINLFSGSRYRKSAPPITSYFNYECKHNKFQSSCSKYTGTIQITQAGYYNLDYDIESIRPLKGYDIKILIYSGLFAYDIGNPPLQNKAQLRGYYLNVGDTLKFTIRSTLLGDHRGTININKI